MQPAISYCPLTTSPGWSLGTNEYGWPHAVQKPSVRPGRPPRERPTGAAQSLFPQNRLRSGTSGCSSTADSGSGRGTGGIVTSPAPSLARPEVAVPDRELRTDTERAPLPAEPERDRRPETDLREYWEGEDDAPEPPDGPPDPYPESGPGPEPVPLPEPEPVEPEAAGSGRPRPAAALPVASVGEEPSMPCADTTGARPQVSQYSSPPPTSS